MAVVSTLEVGRSTGYAGSVTARDDAGTMPADLRGCKVPAAEASAASTVKGTTASTVKTATATMTAAAMSAATVAFGSECCGRERKAAERENCSQRKD
jgi:hypothetical protein